MLEALSEAAQTDRQIGRRTETDRQRATHDRPPYLLTARPAPSTQQTRRHAGTKHQVTDRTNRPITPCFSFPQLQDSLALSVSVYVCFPTLGDLRGNPPPRPSRFDPQKPRSPEIGTPQPEAVC
jgi:hypothetical protein